MSKRRSFKSHFKIQEDNVEEERVGVDDNAEINVEDEQSTDETPRDQKHHRVLDKKPGPKPINKSLNKSEISIRLSGLGKIASGDGYAYLKATITDMGLTDIKAIVNFKHIQYVDLSNNKLTLENLQPVTQLPYLLFLKADSNHLKRAALKKAGYLQVIVLNKNFITTCWDVFQEHLSTLELGYNKIEQICFDKPMVNLKCLDLRYNLIKDVSNLKLPYLHSLYLAGNRIKSLEGIDTLTNLRILHLRNNPISKLDYFGDNMKIIYLNLRNCKIKSLKQIKKLKILPALRTLILKGTPYMGGTGQEGDEGEEDEEVRVQILSALPKLERINKKPISAEERTEARELIMQSLEEGDKEDSVEEEEDDVAEEAEKE